MKKSTRPWVIAFCVIAFCVAILAGIDNEVIPIKLGTFLVILVAGIGLVVVPPVGTIAIMGITGLLPDTPVKPTASAVGGVAPVELENRMSAAILRLEVLANDDADAFNELCDVIGKECAKL